MPSRRRRCAQAVVVRERAVVHEAEVEPGRERVRVLGGHPALGGHARVAERVAALQLAQLEALHELARRARLLVDLDRLAGAHHAQLGVALAQPGLRRLGVGLHDDHRVAGAHLGLAGAERLAQGRRATQSQSYPGGPRQRHLRRAGRRGFAVEGDARAVGAAVAELQQHVAQVAPEAPLSSVDLQKSPAIPHMDAPPSVGPAHRWRPNGRAGAQFAAPRLCESATLARAAPRADSLPGR